jgi:hypothetical protein
MVDRPEGHCLCAMNVLLDGIAASRQLLRGYDGKPGGRHFEDLAA